MTNLEDVFGQEFAQKYEQTIQQRREQREHVDDQTKLRIVNEAVNGGALVNGEEPHFKFTTDEGVTHDVLLMKLPNPEQKPIHSYLRELDSGAVTMPMSYLGEWMSCLFNDPKDAQKLNPGEEYIVIGRITQWTPDDGEPRDQVSPVRGVITLPEAQELAKKALEAAGISRPSSDDSEEAMDEAMDEMGPNFSSSEGEQEEPEQQEGTQEDQEPEQEDSGESIFSEEEEEESVDDTPDVSYEDVKQSVHALAEDHPEVWEVQEPGQRLAKLTNVIMNQMGLDADDNDLAQEVGQHVLDTVGEYHSDDEEEEDDDEEDALF